jgi:tRNA dimethylallyltransferase
MRAIFLMGPTASGKSALALTLADQLPVEIISVDSAAVYRHMNVGTAKPGPAIRARYPHHLLDCIEPTEAYSVARFCADAQAAMQDIVARGRVPLLVGGTMLYFKALREGLDALPGTDATIRQALDEEAALRGWPALHAELARVDPITAARLKTTDAQRIQRALEVYRTSGRTLSSYHRSGSRQPLQAELLSLGWQPEDRAVLHARIAQRFTTMLDEGLNDELRALRERYALRANMPAMRCVGYRQMWQYQDGELTWDEMREKGVIATRQLAKRQMTWLRSWSGLENFDGLDPQAPTALLQRARGFLEQH